MHHATSERKDMVDIILRFLAERDKSQLRVNHY